MYYFLVGQVQPCHKALILSTACFLFLLKPARCGKKQIMFPPLTKIHMTKTEMSPYSCGGCGWVPSCVMQLYGILHGIPLSMSGKHGIRNLRQICVPLMDEEGMACYNQKAGQSWCKEVLCSQWLTDSIVIYNWG